MIRSTPYRAGAALALALFAATALADDVRTHLETHDGGTRAVELVSPGGGGGGADTGTVAARGGIGVEWQRTLTDAVYTTCAIVGSPVTDVAAGTELNPPRQAELVPSVGDGTPTWFHPGTSFRVSASRAGDVIAGVDYESATQTVSVYRWAPDSSTPLWTDTLTGVTPGSYRAIATSADGSTVAVLVSVQAGGPFARCRLYDAATGALIGEHDGPAGFGRNVSIGADGRFVAFIGLATAYVVDRDLDAIRWSGSMGATNDPIAISTDGTYLAFGWTSLQMRAWNGTDYAPAWSIAGGSYQVKSVTFSSDSGTFAAGWYRSDYLQNRIHLFDPSSSTPLWTHLDTPGSGAYQDIPADLALTAGGEYLAVGCWGDAAHTNDEIRLYGHGSPDALGSVGSPGSIFDVDVALDGDGVVVTACGKHVHANETGRGGDLFSITFTEPVAVGDAPGRPLGLAIDVANPLRAGGRIVVSTERATDVELTVYSATGRRVRALGSGMFDAGRHEVTWDGRDDAGQDVAAGVYLVEGRSRDGSVTARTLLLR